MKDVNILTNNGVNVAQSLELFGDMEMYDETLNDFLDLVDGKLTSLENRKTSSDMVNYAIEVHALKSDSRYLGFTTLADMCYESELKSKAGDIMFVQENHPKIMAEAHRMIGVAKQYMGIGGAQAVQPTVQQPQVSQPQVQYYQQPQQAMPQQAVQQPQQVMPQQAVQQPQQAMPQQVVQQPQVVQSVQPAQPQVQFFTQSGAPIGANTGYVQPQVQYYQQPVQQPVYQNPAMTQVGTPKQGIILIVDDSNLVVNFVKKIFDNDYDVLIANDGAKAIEIVDQEDIRKQIKACLLDLNMPNVDGYQVLEHFKQKGYFVRMPVAVESGVEDMASIDRVNAYPIVDILAKPFNERDVKRVIDKCLATYF